MRHRILATTALALIFVASLGGMNNHSNELAAAPVAATFAERASMLPGFAAAMRGERARGSAR